ncbi:MAG: quinol:cytochrome C oxidoreductase [Ignavibacteria bacterium]|nr:quinol:cytochrome C oxidoreductase [Ignavibacteria bacterium]
MIEPVRASFSYLIAFMFLLSIGIGSLFLVALEYLTGADWSTPFRRISEFLASTIPLLIIFAIPLILSIHSLFHWSHTEVVSEDPILKGKAPYLNTSFFIIRVIVVFGIWSLFYFFLTKNSLKQDTTKDQRLTKKNIVLSGIFIPVFAITITVAAVDWLMSLEPHWFSTIFGVYFFSGSVWASLAALTLIVILLNERGYLSSRLNNDHYYSLGTLMFAFTCFWGYIAFSQYMLIWYANLPEENFWFLIRWAGGWEYFSILLIFVHFIIPFGALLSYPAKTNPKRLKFMSVWILLSHYLDLYWLVMPNFTINGHGYIFNWLDFVFPIGILGLLILIFSMKAKKHNLIPVGDPKLQRGFDFTLH